MDESRLQTISQLRAFLAAHSKCAFAFPTRAWCSATCGYSRAQFTRLLMRALHGASLHKRYRSPAHAFARRYAGRHRDAGRGGPRPRHALGPATVHLPGRAWALGDARFERLSELIGLRRAHLPQGRAGFIRIDSLHQERSGRHQGRPSHQRRGHRHPVGGGDLLPALQALIGQFPFVILGFHPDNGSEYINKVVAALLEKLRVEQTRSRPRHSNDNALAQSKNAWVVRKTLGYSHIPQYFVARIDTFCREHLSPRVNLHRPGMFAKEVVDAKGKARKTYPHDMLQTPLDKLASLPGVEQFLRLGITIQRLQAKAAQISDLDAANTMNVARSKLFDLFNRRPKQAA